jgi:hypothetical protein
MITDEGTPIVMDFGSTVKARVEITNRSQALVQQACLSPFYCFRAKRKDRTLQQSKVLWHIALLSCTMLKQTQPSTRRLTFGYAPLSCF